MILDFFKVDTLTHCNVPMLEMLNNHKKNIDFYTLCKGIEDTLLCKGMKDSQSLFFSEKASAMLKT